MSPAPWMCPFFAPVKAMMTTSSLASRVWKSFPLGITLWTFCLTFLLFAFINLQMLYQDLVHPFLGICLFFFFYCRTIRLTCLLPVAPVFTFFLLGNLALSIKYPFSNLSCMHPLRARVTEGHKGGVLKNWNVNAFSGLAGFLIQVCYLLCPCRCSRMRDLP